MKITFLILINLISLSFLCCQSQYQGTKMTSEYGNNNCIELYNSTTRVVLEPNLGGRVLIYELHGNNILWVNKEIEGKSYVPGKNYGDPGSGRFDIGPELTSRSHPQLWLGKWEGQITGPRRATLTSQVDSSSGVKLIRTFSLDANNSHLIVTQDIINMGKDTILRYFWSRTFMEGGGISLTPKNPHSRYPRGYLIYRPKSVIDIRPATEPNVSVIDGVIEIQGPPSDPKFVMDCSEGWLAYISLDNQLFIKRFPVFKGRLYGDVAGNNVSIWYNQDIMCELEPMGPMEYIAPGQRVSFSEHWYLFDYKYPADKNVDLKDIRSRIEACEMK